MRTFARHAAGVLIGMVSATAIVFLTGLGVPEEEVINLLEAAEKVLIPVFVVAGYFITEKVLKRFKRWFPDAWAEKIWKDHAADVVEGMNEHAAKRAIEDGKV